MRQTRKKDPEARHRGRIALIVLGVIVAFLVVVFLPGPNGLVQILLRRHRTANARAEIQRLKTEIDSLEAVATRLQDPDYASEFARRCLGEESPDSLPGTE